MVALPLPQTALTAVAALLGTAYLDGKFSISKDIKQLIQDKNFRRRLDLRIKELGDNVTIYRMLELAQPDAEALWFEGRRWTFAEMKGGMFVNHRGIYFQQR